MKVGIECNGMRESIEYKPGTPVTFKVDFPNAKINRRVVKYLNTPREYWIPESPQIDDYRVEKNVLL